MFVVVKHQSHRLGLLVSSRLSPILPSLLYIRLHNKPAKQVSYVSTNVDQVWSILPAFGLLSLDCSSRRGSNSNAGRWNKLDLALMWIIFPHNARCQFARWKFTIDSVFYSWQWKGSLLEHYNRKSSSHQKEYYMYLHSHTHLIHEFLVCAIKQWCLNILSQDQTPSIYLYQTK